MSDVENAYKQIASFLNNETEKTLLICGIADEEKHRTLLKALNARERSKGLIFLIHTTKDGMENFFRWAGLYKVKVPKKYGQSMQLSNLTIYFDNLSTKSSSNKYDNYAYGRCKVLRKIQKRFKCCMKWQNGRRRKKSFISQ